MSQDCLFCKIVAGEIPAQKVYEDEETYVFLDIFPVSRGHMLIIPKEHSKDLMSGSEEAALQMMRTVYKIAPRVMETLGATAYNLGMNHGKDAGQEIWHSHLHLIPRYSGDKREFVKSKADSEELEELAEILRKKL